MSFLKKHTSKDFWMVKMLAGAALVASAFYYIKGITPAEVLAGLG